MLFSKFFLLALPALALAAPAAEAIEARGDAPDVSVPDPNVLVVGNGYITLDDGVLHEGEYNAVEARDLATHTEEKRIFLTLFLLGVAAKAKARETLYYHPRYPNHVYAPYAGWWYDGHHTHYGRPSYCRPCYGHGQTGWCFRN